MSNFTSVPTNALIVSGDGCVGTDYGEIILVDGALRLMKMLQLARELKWQASVIWTKAARWLPLRGDRTLASWRRVGDGGVDGRRQQFLADGGRSG